MAAMTDTTVPESHLDLLDTRTAILATVGASGKPQLTAIVFLYDTEDGLVKISLNDTRQKVKNLRLNPSATFFILDPENSGRTLEIRGDAEITPDPDFSFAATVGAKYNADFRRNDQPGETRSKVTLHPTRIVATKLY
jgi:PPOX class probable F420-dependent enzyme